VSLWLFGLPQQIMTLTEIVQQVPFRKQTRAIDQQTRSVT